MHSAGRTGKRALRTSIKANRSLDSVACRQSQALGQAARPEHDREWNNGIVVKGSPEGEIGFKFKVCWILDKVFRVRSSKITNFFF